jgi:hypothetical protein
MAKTPKQLDEFLHSMRDQDLSTLRALDQELHLLLQEKRRGERPANADVAAREEISAQCAGIKINPDLLVLVGIHPENAVEEDKLLIRESIAPRPTD